MKKKNKINQFLVFSIVMLILGSGLTVRAQNVCISGNGAAPHVSAMLDVTSTNSGFLVPRMTQAQRDAIGTPATGLLIYQTNGTAGFWYYNGSGWVQISGGGDGWKIVGNAGTIAGTNFIGTTDAVDWVIKTNNTERARVLSGGNVGIGTASPSTRLDVYGAAGASPARFATPDGYVLVGPANAGWSHFTTDRPRFYFNTGGTFDSGNIGSYDENLSLQTSGTTRITALNSNGYVGIATTAPNYNLEINGSFGFGNTSGTFRSRSESRDNAGLQGNAGAQSGFFETVSPSNYPSGASSWWHLIDCRHSNASNNYALQIAGSFFDQKLYFRKTNGSATTPWEEIVTWNQLILNTYGTNNQGVTGTTDCSINSGTFTDMPQMVITFTPIHSKIYINFTFAGWETLSGYPQQYVDFRILKDGAIVGGANCTAGDKSGTAIVTSFNGALNLAVNATPGVPTTIKVQWRNEGNVTSNINCWPATYPEFSHRSLIIID